MPQTDTKPLSRLIAQLTKLQTKRLLTAAWLAEKFEVSKRTIYRDIKALEQAGYCPDKMRSRTGVATICRHCSWHSPISSW